MTSDVVLTAALRNNLLSLQHTQGQIDKTQLNLATGRKINSALDGPQSFFAAQALNNRAGDLTRLLDGIGQSIQVIKAADNGVTALTKLVEQADSVANAARDALAAGQAEAKVTGAKDLRGINDLMGMPGVTAGATLSFSITDEDGNSLDLAAYGAASTSPATVAIGADMSIEELIAAINDLHLDDGNSTALGAKAFEASLDSGGRLQIKTVNGGDFNLEFTTTADTDAANLSLANELGFGNIARLVADPTDGTNNVEFTTVSDVKLESFVMQDTNGIAQASAALDTLVDDAGNPLFSGFDSANDTYDIRINGGAVQSIPLSSGGNSISIQQFVDSINANSTLNEHIRASYDAETGKISLDPVSGDLESIQIGVSGDGGEQANFGFGLTDMTVGGGAESASETIRLAAATADLAQFEKDFESIRTQITELVSNGDTGYRGTNLLNGDDLFTVFNELRTSTLTTNGVDFSADGLGLKEANFSRVSSTEAVLANVREALDKVRNFGLTLANDLSVIQTREGFTQNMINTLSEGADKLTVADQNEEGAKLLALQTRQQLGVTSLSLASQSQQAILRLF